MKTGRAYVLSLNTRSSDSNKFQQLVTLDAPTNGAVFDSCDTDRGLMIGTTEIGRSEDALMFYLPMPGNSAGMPYNVADKMEFVWKSKKFVMPGRTTFSVMKVQYSGCVKVQLFVDGCCGFQTMLTTCSAFRLPSQLAGYTFEVQFSGTGIVKDFEMASSMEELAKSG